VGYVEFLPSKTLNGIPNTAGRLPVKDFSTQADPLQISVGCSGWWALAGLKMTAGCIHLLINIIFH